MGARDSGKASMLMACFPNQFCVRVPRDGSFHMSCVSITPQQFYCGQMDLNSRFQVMFVKQTMIFTVPDRSRDPGGFLVGEDWAR